MCYDIKEIENDVYMVVLYKMLDRDFVYLGRKKEFYDYFIRLSYFICRYV